MRYIIAAATAFALVAGIALGIVVSRGLDGSASAAPTTRAVEEQNVDPSGFIAVHEQGTADVERGFHACDDRKAHRAGDTGCRHRRRGVRIVRRGRR